VKPIRPAGITGFAAVAGLIAALSTAGCAGPVSAPAAAGAVASADGVEIRYRSSGSGDPALVFVHCWSCDRSYWERQAGFFSTRHRVVMLDLGGHGGSGLGRTEWTIEAFAEDVVAVVEALGLPRVVLVGHSMGSLVAVEAARRIPDRVAGVVAVDSLHDVERTYTSREKEEFLGRLRDDFPIGAAEFVRRNLFSAQTPPDLAAWITDDMSTGPPDVGIGAMESILDFDVRVALAQVRAPVHCINSDRFPTNQQAARRYSQTFQVHTISGVGHFPMLEKPEQFNLILLNVVRALGS
jgi:pimeloyl-ACP methyl ester carboxylesterase